MQHSTKGRSWPLSIIGIFIFLSFMLFGILYISLKYVPVNRENVYQMGYQDVDKNFNDIREAQELFDKRYSVSFDVEKFSEPIETIRVNGEKVYFDHALQLGENHFGIQVKDKEGSTVQDAKLSLLLTRFDTSEFDKTVGIASINDGMYQSEPFSIKREGRWKIVAKISVDETTGYFEKNVYAR